MNNKKELLAMRSLPPTKKMIELAGQDVPVLKKCYYQSQKYYNEYKTPLYLRAQILQGILKISIHTAERIRQGIYTPIYNLFIDFKNDQFITYDCLSQKWTDAMLFHLDFPIGITVEDYVVCSKCYINREAANSLKRHLGIKKADIQSIIKYQKGIRKLQLEERERKIFAPWDKELSQTPKLPKDWDSWLRRTGITDHYIFYHYNKRGAKTGYCTRCGHTVPIKNPKNGLIKKCECCRGEVQFRSYGKMPFRFNSDTEDAYIIQKTNNGYVLRQFECNIILYKDNPYKPTYLDFEFKRVFLDSNFNVLSEYLYTDWKHRLTRWVKINSQYNYYYSQKGKLYTKNLPYIESMKYSGLYEMAKNRRISPIEYIRFYKKYPGIEKLPKAGLFRLADDIYTFREEADFLNANGELSHLLGINKSMLKTLRKINGGRLAIKWFKYFEARNKGYEDDDVKWFEEHNVKPDKIKFITDRMTERKIVKYLKKQLTLRPKETANSLIGIWQDYFSMAKRLNYNMMLEINYMPKNLFLRHNELIEKSGENGAELASQALAISEKYPNVDKVIQSFTKYEYKGKKYSVISPKSIEDILNDSNELNHCVATSPDRYFERINNRESYILFLRNTGAEDKPFYTLEIEPNGTVRQTRSYYNEQGKDIKKIKEFLLVWQKEISKILTSEDCELGVNSNEKRIKDYIELRSKKIKINGGVCRGQLLADVLERDLIINTKICV